MLKLFSQVVMIISIALPALALPPRPKLVVVIVIDQFRADYLTRFQSRFLPLNAKGGPGFNLLMKKGAYFPFATYDVMQSMTGPGHSIILTGSYPYANRIPLNVWYDSHLKRYVYCVDDPTVKIVGDSGETQGVSPRNLVATTVGDALKDAGYHSRVISLALKDRAAILLGGHRADLALWFDSKTFEWVSSSYYLKDNKLPIWVQALNGTIRKKMGQQIVWSSTKAYSGLTEPVSFRHVTVFGKPESLRYPTGLELTTKAALSALKVYNLGHGPDPDLLAIGYSSHDMLGHKMGPNAREMEALTVAEDHNIAQLIAGIKAHMGNSLKNVVIVLTGDHGIGPSTTFLKGTGIDSGHLTYPQMLAIGEKALSEKFGKPETKWIAGAKSFNFYLNPAEIESKHLQQAKVEAELKKALQKIPGVEFVFTRTDYELRHLPPGMYKRQILHTYVPGRNGDVVIIPRPFYTELAGEPVTHMTGYSYDRTVPLAIYGARVKVGRYVQAHMVDLAPTLSYLLEVIPPSLSEGRVLKQAIIP